MKKDSHARTLVKTISWRFIATATTMLAAYILTGRIEIALSIGAIDGLWKFFFYYFHERAWENVKWGK